MKIESEKTDQELTDEMFEKRTDGRIRFAEEVEKRIRELNKEVGTEIERIFIKVRKAFISSLNGLGKRNISWNMDTLERMVREKLPEDNKKRFFEEVLKFESNWVLNRLKKRSHNE